MKKLIVANWKMYPTLPDSVVLGGHYHKTLADLRGVDIVLAPPLPWLIPVKESSRSWPDNIKFAVQNLYPVDQGAYTGEISAYMVRNIVSYAIIGHSERRQYQGEDNDLINNKVHAALRWGIKPIICIGEKKHSGEASPSRTLVEQAESAIAGVDDDNFHKIIFAYEPIWAIGTGHNALPSYVVSVIKYIQKHLQTKYGHRVDEIRYIYGGSVNAINSYSYLMETEITGLLVGHSSVKSKEFEQICKLASER